MGDSADPSVGSAGGPDLGVRALIIVARDRKDIWEHFTRLFATDRDVEVRYDRRFGDRRSARHPISAERRRQNRRHPTRDTDLRTRHYLIVRKRRRDDVPVAIPNNGSFRR